MMTAVRTWKRDGSTNTMDFLIAARNLVYNGVVTADEVLKLPLEFIQQRLREGATLETPLARFHVPGAGKRQVRSARPLILAS